MEVSINTKTYSTQLFKVTDLQYATFFGLYRGPLFASTIAIDFTEVNYE
ncbi:hypothetical protein CYCME_1596 [Cycloclasticus zancles 78-ME]|uniref:Uncharacterized protein n=1 Tax=Cycloclasticus zancles 78-ME TaxID=1198232 RepID=S5T803_9GAMM|nr:hypothetical protein CYCME_1596 [Cycloclasticus zancles 78-ME]